MVLAWSSTQWEGTISQLWLSPFRDPTPTGTESHFTGLWQFENIPLEGRGKEKTQERKKNYSTISFPILLDLPQCHTCSTPLSTELLLKKNLLLSCTHLPSAPRAPSQRGCSLWSCAQVLRAWGVWFHSSWKEKDLRLGLSLFMNIRVGKKFPPQKELIKD